MCKVTSVQFEYEYFHSKIFKKIWCIQNEISILISQCICSCVPVEHEEAVAVWNHAPPPLVHHCGGHSEEGEGEQDEGLSLSDQVPDRRNMKGQWVCALCCEQRATRSILTVFLKVSVTI